MTAPRPARDTAITAALLLGVAVLLRSAQFGNPINGLDEQYYLLVGDRMWSGALPYVDLWDRKPFGLFALFAAIRLLGGGGVMQAQIVATLFAAATALIVTRIAQRSVPRTPAILAGIFYLVALQMLWGGTTQTPVFYNLFVAAAAMLVLTTAPALGGLCDVARAAAAMLLCGLAIQIKTNAVFEGGLLGLWLLWRLHRAAVPLPRIARLAALFALLGLAPTLVVMLGYAAIGEFPAWWFANVQSMLQKQGTLGTPAWTRLREMIGLMLPIFAIAAIGLLRARHARRWTEAMILAAGWACAALVDAVALGGFWPHYALPFAVPAAILAAHAFTAPRWGRLAFVVLVAYPTLDAVVLDRVTATDERRIAAATLATLPADVRTRCLLIYEGPVIYYHLTHACLTTKFAFSDHLRSSAETAALGENAATALRNALARKPAAILTLHGSLWTERNRTNDAILSAELARNYHPVARLPHRHYSTGREWLIVWHRNAGRRPNVVRKISSLPAYHRARS